MGLDMYLEKRININAEYEHRNVKVDEIKISVAGIPVTINTSKIGTITERAGYWRKANAIHKWFVDNVQGGEDNCEEYWVSKEDLEKLLADCMAVKQDNSLSEKLLPPTTGFFFGGTDLDEWYFAKIDDTIQIVKDCLMAFDDQYKDFNFYYSSSW